MNNIRINSTSRSFFFLAVILATNRQVTNSILHHTTSSGTGAPASALLSGALTLLLIWFITHRCTLFSKSDIFTSLENKLGKIPTFIFGIFLICYLFLSSSYLLTESSQLLKLISFPDSPLWFVGSFLILGALCGALSGIDNLFRISVFIALFFIFIIILLCLSVLPQSNPNNLFPIFGLGINNTISGGISGICLYPDILLLFLLYPKHSPQRASGRIVIIATIIGVLFTLLLTITYTAKIPYPVSEQEKFPIYLLLKEVYFGRFFQRIDSFFLLSVSLIQMLSVGLNLYLISKIFQRVFETTSKKAIIFPTSIILFSAITGLISISSAIINASAYILFGLFAVIAIILGKETAKKP